MTESMNDELILRVKTSSPESCLHNLMRAIAASLRWAAHADKTNVDPDHMAHLAQFLEQITPNE